jgi:hypothetical protein
MFEWIVIVVLYVVGMAFFHILGGLGAAADALERWGRASAGLRTRHAPSK